MKEPQLHVRLNLAKMLKLEKHFRLFKILRENARNNGLITSQCSLPNVKRAKYNAAAIYMNHRAVYTTTEIPKKL